MTSITSQKLWLPNDHGVLQESGSLIINDAPWLETHGMNFVHPKLSYEVTTSYALSSDKTSAVHALAAICQLDRIS